MKSSPIIHEWFYPGGPDTFEYLIPVEQFSHGHDSMLPEWIRSFASSSLSDAKRLFEEYLKSVAHSSVSTFTSAIETLVPHSIVVHESNSWLLCKLQSQWNETSAHGNMVQLPAPNTNVEWPPFFDSDLFASLKHFLSHFGGTRIDIPPTCGTLAPLDIQPVYEDLETYAWKNIGTWEGSCPVYNAGNGDVVLVDANMNYGTWSHELGDDPSGAVQTLGCFEQFMKFVVSQIGIT